MEDTSIQALNFNGHNNHIFGIFDGHGGKTFFYPKVPKSPFLHKNTLFNNWLKTNITLIEIINKPSNKHLKKSTNSLKLIKVGCSWKKYKTNSFFKIIYQKEIASNVQDVRR